QPPAPGPAGPPGAGPPVGLQTAGRGRDDAPVLRAAAAFEAAAPWPRHAPV
ncbi:MAG: amidase, partial [Acidimicrobiaceae bacterium]|nr:amidase [Acidimicrobiaceae bacterium]